MPEPFESLVPVVRNAKALALIAPNSPTRPLPPLAGGVSRLDERLQILAQALRHLAVAVDGPLQQRSTEHHLDASRQPGSVAARELAAGNRFIEQRFDLGAHRA